MSLYRILRPWVGKPRGSVVGFADGDSPRSALLEFARSERERQLDPLVESGQVFFVENANPDKLRFGDFALLRYVERQPSAEPAL